MRTKSERQHELGRACGSPGRSRGAARSPEGSRSRAARAGRASTSEVAAALPAGVLLVDLAAHQAGEHHHPEGEQPPVEPQHHRERDQRRGSSPAAARRAARRAGTAATAAPARGARAAARAPTGRRRRGTPRRAAARAWRRRSGASSALKSQVALASRSKYGAGRLVGLHGEYAATSLQTKPCPPPFSPASCCSKRAAAGCPGSRSPRVALASALAAFLSQVALTESRSAAGWRSSRRCCAPAPCSSSPRRSPRACCARSTTRAWS